MISTLLIHPNIESRVGEAQKILAQLKLSQNHPNVLWFGDEDKLGIEQARNIKEFLSLKPYQEEFQAVVLISAQNLTQEGQNALLKTLEEPTENVSIILGAPSEDTLLPTIISRCKTVHVQDSQDKGKDEENKHQEDIEKLINSNYEKRFQFIEKLEDKENFLVELIKYFRHDLLKNSAGVHTNPPQGWIVDFLKDLVEAEKWAKSNVNIRAILEYLMLKMPQNRV